MLLAGYQVKRLEGSMMFNIICFDKFLERFFRRSYTFGYFWLSVIEGHFFE